MDKKPRFIKKKKPERAAGLIDLMPGITFGNVFRVAAGIVGFAIAVVKSMEDAKRENDQVPAAGRCYRCGNKLQGFWLTMSIDGKDQTVCVNNCKSK